MSTTKRRRKSKSAVIYIPLAIVIVSSLVILGASVFLRVIEIEVTGALKYKVDEIIMASGISVGDNLLFLDRGGAAKSIQAAMPYINDVSIEIQIPDKVRISVSESIALATITDQRGVLVIDSAGRVLDITDRAPDGLIEIRGFTPVNSVEGNALRAETRDETRLRCLLEVMDVIVSAGIEGDVSFIDVSNIVYLNFQYHERFNVMLGSTDNIRYKMGTLFDIVTETEASRPKDETGTIYLSDREPGRWAPDR